jgi:hypothetical protein
MELCEKLRRVVWLFVGLLCVTLAAVCPLYILRATDGSDSVSTHSETYAWFWTLAYLRGEGSAALVLLAWVVVLGACGFHLLLAPLLRATSPPGKCGPRTTSTAAPSGRTDTSFEKFKAYSWVALALLANGAVAMLANVSYIYSIHQPLSPVFHFVVQVGMAVFRLLLAYCAFPFWAKSVADPVSNIHFRLQLLVLCNFVVPCAVTAFTSPSCFQVHTPPLFFFFFFFFFFFCLLSWW